MQLLDILLKLLFLRVVHSQTLSNASKKAVENVTESFPFLDEMKLHSELSVIYSRLEVRNCCGAVPLLQLLIESNLAETFSETVLLLKPIISLPMTFYEAERCFSTLKTFLRSTRSEDRLNALAMLSIERTLLEIQLTSIKM